MRVANMKSNSMQLKETRQDEREKMSLCTADDQKPEPNTGKKQVSDL